MNRYPFWRYALIGLALIFSLIYTLPNFYGESPAVQISSQKATIKVDAATESQALAALGMMLLGALMLLARSGIVPQKYGAHGIPLRRKRRNGEQE